MKKFFIVLAFFSIAASKCNKSSSNNCDTLTANLLPSADSNTSQQFLSSCQKTVGASCEDGDFLTITQFIQKVTSNDFLHVPTEKLSEKCYDSLQVFAFSLTQEQRGQIAQNTGTSAPSGSGTGPVDGGSGPTNDLNYECSVLNMAIRQNINWNGKTGVDLTTFSSRCPELIKGKCTEQEVGTISMQLFNNKKPNQTSMLVPAACAQAFDSLLQTINLSIP